MTKTVLAVADDDDLEIELVEHKPLRHDAISKASSPAEFTLLNWASGAFAIVIFATAVSLAVICYVQAAAIASGYKNTEIAENCMISLAASRYDQNCYVELKSVTEINTLFRNRWIHFMGESSSRDVFHALKSLQFGQEQSPIKRGDHSDQIYRAGSSLATFKWTPFMTDVVGTDLPKNRGVFSHPDYVYISVGLHDILYRNEGLEPDTSKFVNKLQMLTQQTRLVMLEVPHAIDRSRLSPPKAEAIHFNNEAVSNWIDSLTNSIRNLKLNVVVLSRLQEDPFQDQDDGIHSMLKTALTTERLAQIIFWDQFPARSSPFSSAVFSLAAAGVLVVGAVAWFQMRSSFFSVCSSESVTAYCASVSKPQSLAIRIAFMSYPEAMLKFLQSCAIVLVIMAAVYLADGPRPAFSLNHKTRNNVVFAALYIAALCIAMVYRRRVPANFAGDRAVLNRLQTEEWKGMMQVAFVWYHLFDAASTYNLIRVFVTCYVWMTGFGNFIFFQSKQDFSLLRIMKILFRLNFLVVLLCVVLDREWMLYYICPLHTVYFLFVWLVARFPPSPSSPQTGTFKAVASSVLIFAIFIVPGLFERLFSIWGSLFLRNGSLWEWRFRAQLDAFSSSMGILGACLLPTAVTYVNKLDDRTRRKVAASSVCVLIAWLIICYPMEKSDYNRLHPYIGFIPLLAYLVLRNVFPGIRETYMPLFQFIGTITLETYLLQLHLYMSHDAKMVIMYLPENPILNFVVSTCVFLLASYLIFKATVAINDFLFPSIAWSEILLRRILPVAAILSGGVLLDSVLKLSLHSNPFTKPF